MDEVDRQIMKLLYQDGRQSHEAIARAVNLSRPAVHARIKRLEEAGLIRGYKALLDWPALGQPLTAFLFVRTGGARFSETSRAVMALQFEAATAEEFHRLAGEWCMLVKVRAESPLGLQEVIDKVLDVPGVQGSKTVLALSTLSEQGGWGE